MANKPQLKQAAGNSFASTLNGSITDSATSITVADGSGLNAEGGYFIIDEGVSGKEEIVYANSVSSNTLTIADDGRGLSGTSAASHDSGATITDVIVAEHINDLIDQVEVEHNDDGTHGDVSATSVTASGTVAGANVTASSDVTATGNVWGGTINGSSAVRASKNSNGFQEQDSGDTYRTIATIDGSDNVELGNASLSGDIELLQRHKHVMPRGVTKLTSTQTIDTATNTTISFDSEDTDTDSMIDIAGNPTRVTAPVNGVYSFNLTLTINSSDLADYPVRVRLTKNGTAVANGAITIQLDTDMGGIGPAYITTSGDIVLSATDYLEVTVYHRRSAATMRIQAAEFTVKCTNLT